MSVSDDGNAWHTVEIDSESPKVSIGAIAAHCFFVAAVAGCCCAMLGVGQDQGGGTVAGVESERTSLHSPEDAMLHLQQDLRSAITFALGGLMTFFAQSSSPGSAGRGLIKRLNVVASLL